MKVLQASTVFLPLFFCVILGHRTNATRGQFKQGFCFCLKVKKMWQRKIVRAWVSLFKAFVFLLSSS